MLLDLVIVVSVLVVPIRALIWRLTRGEEVIVLGRSKDWGPRELDR